MPRLLESNRAEEGEFMDRAIQFPAKVLSRDAQSEHELGLFSTESVLNLQKLIFAGSPLCEVLANIAQLVESQAEGMSCTIWLPDEDGRELHCAAAPSLPGFIANVGTMAVGPKGGSCGTNRPDGYNIVLSLFLASPSPQSLAPKSCLRHPRTPVQNGGNL